MRYVAILGSHLAEGITAQYLTALLQDLPAEATGTKIFLPDYEIYPDTKAATCPALDTIEAEMAAADVWIICAPTYWAGLSGVMKQFFDCMRFRLVRMNSIGDTLPGPYKGKHYLSMTTCFVSSRENLFTGVTDQTLGTIDRVLTGAGLNKIGEFVGTGTWGTHAPRPEKLAECHRLAAKVTRHADLEDNTMKRYLQLFFMVAVMTLITMGLQNWWFHVFTPDRFWMAYGSFVLIFYLLLAACLHFFTFVRHRRR